MKNPPLIFGRLRYVSIAPGNAAIKSSSFFGISKRAGDQVDHFPEEFRPVSPPQTRKHRLLLLLFP